MIDDEQDNVFITDKQRQLEAETQLCKESNIDEVDMAGTIALSKLTNVAPDKTMSKNAGSLLKDLINLAFIS